VINSLCLSQAVIYTRLPHFEGLHSACRQLKVPIHTEEFSAQTENNLIAKLPKG
jgi:hypothetical protein